MTSDKKKIIHVIVERIVTLEWDDLQGSLEDVQHYRHIFLEPEVGNNVCFHIEYVKGKPVNDLR